MTDQKFDPYHRWLGVKQSEVSDHYVLLGVSRFEKDVEVIRDAAERRSEFVRKHASGPHADAANEILNQLAKAEATLCTPEKKSKYDKILNAKIAKARTSQHQDSIHQSEVIASGVSLPSTAAGASPETEPKLDASIVSKRTKRGAVNCSVVSINPGQRSKPNEKNKIRELLAFIIMLVALVGVAVSTYLLNPSDGKSTIDPNTESLAEVTSKFTNSEVANNDNQSSETSKKNLPANHDKSINEMPIRSESDEGNLAARSTPAAPEKQPSKPQPPSPLVDPVKIRQLINHRHFSSGSIINKRKEFPSDGNTNPEFDLIEQRVLQLMQRHPIPGLSVAVSHLGETVYSRAFGYADASSLSPMSTDTFVRTGDISKTITSAATLQFVEQGKINLSDSIFDLLVDPEQKNLINPASREVTILDCLQQSVTWQRSADGDLMFQPLVVTKEFGLTTPPKMTDFATYAGQISPEDNSGTEFSSSNCGYCLLGRLIEKLSGRSYESHVSNNVLKPLGIFNMRLADNQSYTSESKYHYASSKEGESSLVDWDIRPLGSSVGWVSTPVELLKFINAFNDPANCKILGENSIATMLNPPTGNIFLNERFSPKNHHYGIGWWVKTIDGLANTWVSGNLPGSASFVYRNRDGICLVALANQSKLADGTRVDDLLKQTLSMAVEEWSVQNQLLLNELTKKAVNLENSEDWKACSEIWSAVLKARQKGVYKEKPLRNMSQDFRDAMINAAAISQVTATQSELRKKRGPQIQELTDPFPNIDWNTNSFDTKKLPEEQLKPLADTMAAERFFVNEVKVEVVGTRRYCRLGFQKIRTRSQSASDWRVALTKEEFEAADQSNKFNGMKLRAHNTHKIGDQVFYSAVWWK